MQLDGDDTAGICLKVLSHRFIVVTWCKLHGTTIHVQCPTNDNASDVNALKWCRTLTCGSMWHCTLLLSTASNVQVLVPSSSTYFKNSRNIVPSNSTTYNTPRGANDRCLVHKSLSEQAPQYLVDDVLLVADSGWRLLWSASDRTCVVP